MVKEVKTGLFQIFINIEGNWWSDTNVINWMHKLKERNESAYNSRRTYANALNIFLHYYIYIPKNDKESLYDYLLRFRENLLSGFVIRTEREIITPQTKYNCKYIVLKVEPLSKGTINTYMRVTRYYLSFLKEQIPNNRIESLIKNEINWTQLKHKLNMGKGAGYGLRMNPLLTQLLGPKIPLIRDFKVDRESSMINCFFPPELILSLLDISSPREQAIYLLCACAGTRIGQALSLTRDDYNTKTREVFIVDPLSEETGPSGKVPRAKLLKSTYQINMEKTPYKYVACKYPIPSQYTELLWIHPLYREMFFRAINLMEKGNPIKNGHPFIFNTSSGKILTPNESNRIFESKIRSLKSLIRKEWFNKREETKLKDKKELNDNYIYLLDQLDKVTGLHALRHTYGVLWSDRAANEPDLSIEEAQTMCQFGMGQTSLKSVLNYFTIIRRGLPRRESKTDNVNTQFINFKDYLHEKKILVNTFYKRNI